MKCIILINEIKYSIAPSPLMVAFFNNDIEICSFLTQKCIHEIVLFKHKILARLTRNFALSILSLVLRNLYKNVDLIICLEFFVHPKTSQIATLQKKVILNLFSSFHSKSLFRRYKADN